MTSGADLGEGLFGGQIPPLRLKFPPSLNLPPLTLKPQELTAADFPFSQFLLKLKCHHFNITFSDINVLSLRQGHRPVAREGWHAIKKLTYRVCGFAEINFCS